MENIHFYGGNKKTRDELYDLEFSDDSEIVIESALI